MGIESLEFNSNYISVCVCLFVCGVCFVGANKSLLFLFSKLITRELEVCRCYGDRDLGDCVCIQYVCAHLCVCVSKNRV